MKFEDSDSTPTPRPPDSGPTPPERGSSSGGPSSRRPRRRPEEGGSPRREDSGGPNGPGSSSGSRERSGGNRERSGPGGERDRERRPRSGGGGRDRERGRKPAGSGAGKPAPVKAAEPGDEPSAGSAVNDDLLASVSRSFSLTINLLPPELRQPISLGYLLARALDTIADAGAPAPKRLEHLRALLEMIKYGPDTELLPPLRRDIAPAQTHEGEKELIKQLPRALRSLDGLLPTDQWELRRTLARIGRGQELDILRFGDAKADAPKALETAADLDEYTYFVAGCVGEFWTWLCAAHLPAGWSKLPQEEMLKLGKRFGQGLQMVNILRDLPADLNAGRCYLPADLLAKHNLAPAALRAEPARARPLVDELRRVTLEHLDAAWQYVSALAPRKLRYACALPVLIGLETLGLLASTPALETGERVKMTRGALSRLMASATVGSVLPVWLNGLHKRLRRRAEG